MYYLTNAAQVSFNNSRSDWNVLNAVLYYPRDDMLAQKALNASSWFRCVGLSYSDKHAHSRLTALFPGPPRWAGTGKVKPIWILLKQETVSGSGISWAICKVASRSWQITTPAPHHSVFYRPDALPAAQPTASRHWRQLSYIAFQGIFRLFQNKATLLWIKKYFCHGTSTIASIVNLVRPITAASLSHWAFTFVYCPTRRFWSSASLLGVVRVGCFDFWRCRCCCCCSLWRSQGFLVVVHCQANTVGWASARASGL